MTKLFVPILIFVSFQLIAQEQVDSTKVEPEVVRERWVPKPKRAALLSLIPGAGQFYNRKYAYLKVPVIYGAFAGIGYWASDNQNQYERYRDAYELAVNGETHEFGNASTDDIKRARDNFDKFRQRTYITLGAIYLAQILEAYVAAHLIDFDIDEDISIQFKPSYEEEYDGKVGFGAALKF